MHWRPYLPEEEDSIGLLAQTIAIEKSLVSDKLELDDNLTEHILAAQQNNEIVILLIDVWTIDLPKYHARIRPYDNFMSMNSALFILWNNRDTETAQKKERLKDKIRKTFKTKTTYRNPILFHDHVDTPEGLKAQLRDTLERLMMNIISTGHRKRIVPPTDDGEMPRLRNIN